MDPEVAKVLAEILPREIVDIIRGDFLEVCKRPEAKMIREEIFIPDNKGYIVLNSRRVVLSYEICKVCGDIPHNVIFNFCGRGTSWIERGKIAPSHNSICDKIKFR